MLFTHVFRSLNKIFIHSKYISRKIFTIADFTTLTRTKLTNLLGKLILISLTMFAHSIFYMLRRQIKEDKFQHHTG